MPYKDNTGLFGLSDSPSQAEISIAFEAERRERRERILSVLIAWAVAFGVVLLIATGKIALPF